MMTEINSPKNNSGFTLIELMITVAIIGILAAIAYPSYQDSVRKARRTDGISALTTAAQAMERCGISNSSIYYIAGTSDCRPAAAYDSADGYYQITSSATATTFIFTATAQNQQSSDSYCTTLTISNTGLQDSTGSASAATCWGN